MNCIVNATVTIVLIIGQRAVTLNLKLQRVNNKSLNICSKFRILYPRNNILLTGKVMNRGLARVYKPKFVKFALNIWPPFWGAGIKIEMISDDFRNVRMRLKLRWWNKNANRSQYGGSIFSLTDPVYSLMLMGILGEQYYVWDKEANINFIKPGASDLYAEFQISQDVLQGILAQTSNGDKCFPEFMIFVKDSEGNVVSEVQRKLYVRKKPKFRQFEQEKNASI